MKTIVKLIFIFLFLTELITPLYSQFPTFLEIANPNPVGSGARALGQGNAFIAIADDATSASWNPGGLPQLETPEISFALEYVKRNDRLNQHPSENDFFDLKNVNYASAVLPFFFNNNNYVFSINYLRLFSFNRELTVPYSQVITSSGTSRTGEFSLDQDGEFSVITPALAVDITTRLSFGAALNFWDHSLTHSSFFKKKEFQTRFLSAPGSPSRNRGALMTINEFEVTDGHSVVLGGLYRFNSKWNLGMVVKPGYELELDRIENILADDFNGNLIFQPNLSDTSNAELEFPTILGLGLAWRPADALTLTTDVTWTDWSDYRFIENGQESNPLNSTIDDLKDTFTVRFGGEFLFISENYLLPIRWGAGYDPTPGITQVDDYYTVNLGVGLQLHNRINFDLAWEYRWGKDVNVDTLKSFGISQDIHRHRILASMICYF